ncbi:hypothetical protein FSB75_14105 [Flavisolibacter ginsenosidimutans]|uniref:POTRA domain-containing protein n=1 Tax=Flavisolibacter ginsenosidimutans TaxID=661481 RepID=A0A5B8UJY5_9BACT|nr:hypothetical protein FSB75_14105 [Flavisolibacter ginsenosidimutans]
MRICLPILGCCVLLLSFGDGKAQDVFVNSVLLYSTDHLQATTPVADSVFTIKEIIIAGNKRTRKSTVLRELPFHASDTYPLAEIVEKLEVTQRQLMNTGLFRSVVVNLQSASEEQVIVNIQVEEKWYFYPQPFVRIANGSFSQWNDRGRPLNHLNYGIKLTQYNFSGRNDKAYINLTSGYTKKIALQYQGFYFDKALKWSGSLSVAHGKNREINYITQNNKVISVKDPDGYLYEFSQASFDLLYRPAIKTRHTFSVGYNYNRIADTVRKLNKNYAPTENVYRFPYLSYSVSFTDFDFNPYPTRGRYADFSIYKAGINNPVNLWQLAASGTQYLAAGRKGYFSVKLAGMLKLPFKQPYITQQFLGYGDAYLQGYENYIIDGVAGGYSKQTFGYNLLKTEIPLPKKKWFKSLHNIPLKVYAKVYTNEGYVYNPAPGFTNGLTNRMLYSTGFGIDILAFTDLLFKIEWSFNRLGQNGIFLHQ